MQPEFHSTVFHLKGRSNGRCRRPLAATSSWLETLSRERSGIAKRAHSIWRLIRRLRLHTSTSDSAMRILLCGKSKQHFRGVLFLFSEIPGKTRLHRESKEHLEDARRERVSRGHQVQLSVGQRIDVLYSYFHCLKRFNIFFLGRASNCSGKVFPRCG
jgi:hypothetical protein